MKLKDFKITGPESYESWTGLRGTVKLVGDTGSMELVLSPGSISRILASLEDELARVAQMNAAQVGNAVKDAVDGGLLLESDGEVKIPF